MKIRPVEAELFNACGWAGGKTGMTKLIVTFRNFANAPKKGRLHTRDIKMTKIQISSNESSIYKLKAYIPNFTGHNTYYMQNKFTFSNYSDNNTKRTQVYTS